VSDPILRRDGNLRLAGLPSPGYPVDPIARADEARRLATAGGGEPYGPATLLFAMPPEGAVAGWECLVGVAMTGMARPGSVAADGQRLLVEDYRDLNAFCLGHDGAIRDLGATWKRCDEHARRQGYRVRPYWRLQLVHRRLADGNLHPVAEVSVFIDKQG
jgi:hypothetical protein